VRPEVVHPTQDVSPRGYKLAGLRDVVERYLQGDSENPTARTHATNSDRGFYAHGDVHTARSACGSKIVQNVNKISSACGCADRKPEKHLEREKPALAPPIDSLEDFETDCWSS
jgi:hypothetical protein